MRVRSAPRKKKQPPASAPVLRTTIAATPPARQQGLQGFTVNAFAAVAAVIAIVALSQGVLRDGSSPLTAALLPDTSPAADEARAEIGLEHAKPVTLSLALTTNGPRGVADLRHDALETIFISLPSSWTKREVGGVPLSAVQADSPVFGFTRWRIPPNALVSFDIIPPQTILLHNPSGIPAEIDLTRVDLAKNSVERDIILIQKGSAVLW